MNPLPKNSSLVTKLSVLITFSVLLALFILGYHFDDFLKERSLLSATQRMQHGYDRLIYNLKNIEQELKNGIEFIKTEEKLIASIELINNYQDKNNYDPFLIDEEKKIIATELLNRVKHSFNTDISIYDKNSELIAYVTKSREDYQLYFISFEDGSEKIYHRDEHQALYTTSQLPPDNGITLKHKNYYTANQLQLGTLVTYHEYGGNLVFKSHQSIFQGNTENVIGHIEMSRRLDNAYFEKLSSDFILDITASFDTKFEKEARALNQRWDLPTAGIIQTEQAYIGALKKEIDSGTVYFVTQLDKIGLNTALDESRQHFLMLLIFIAVATLLLMRYLISRSVGRPLATLMAQIRKIEKQDYTSSEPVATGDELQDISTNVNHLALTVKEREKQLEQSRVEQEYLSNHDALTGLPNRRLFSSRLEQSLDSAKQNSSQVAILFLDLDQFKLVNDTLGHDIGDKLLVEVANRLRPQSSETQLLARIGGDEFNVLIEGMSDVAALKHTVKKYLALFHPPFQCAGLELSISVSIGVALYPRDGEDSVTLIKNADLAMYKSKDKGRNNYSFYTDDLAEQIQQRADMIQALKNAIESGDQFELHYQPKIAVSTGLMHAVEGLIRWNSPVFGKVMPDQFIMLAEETGLISQIGQWVLHQGCNDFIQLQKEGMALDHISLNVSNVQLNNADMMTELRHIIDSTGITPSQVELEITESYIASDVNNAIQILKSLRDIGFNLAIDDFGTGYSSMSYLNKLPITRIKIDKSFIDGIPHHPDSVTLTKAIISLAKNFGLTTTAEGVENDEQRLFLEQAKCDEIQGYLYAKPMPIDELRKYFRSTSSQSVPDNIIHLPNTTNK